MKALAQLGGADGVEALGAIAPETNLFPRWGTVKGRTGHTLVAKSSAGETACSPGGGVLSLAADETPAPA